MEHLIGKGIDRTIGLIHGRRMARWKSASEPFVLEGNLRRFAAVASMVSGIDLDAVEIRGDTPPRHYRPVLHRMAHPALMAEHGFGWTDGETLFLPVSIAEGVPGEARAGERGGGEDMAKLLLFFLAHQAGCGSIGVAAAKRSLLAGDRALSDLFWIIENTRLLGVISRDWPGVARDWPAAARFLLSRRPPAKYLNRAEERAERFLRETVEGTLGGPSPSDSASAGESLALAVELKRKWEASGASFRRYRALVPFLPWGKLVAERVKARDDVEAAGPSPSRAPKDAAGDGEGPDDGGAPAGEDREAEKKRRYASRSEEVDEEANEQGLALNIYDKVLSWAEFVNVTRPFDDDPDQDAGKKADAMEELTTAELSRTTANTFDAELERVDNRLETGEEDCDGGAGKVYRYPEWDYRRRRYRPDYSVVAETAAVEEKGEFVNLTLRTRRAVIREVTRNLELLTPETRLAGRLIEGELIDLNAAVEAISDMEAGSAPDERLYASYIRSERDLSVLFLIDLSMSTDAWVGERRVIDHEKEALVILCESLKKLQDRYSVYGFSGKTRRGCKFFRVKGFDEGYGERVRDRITGLAPYSYTRMGPAVRRATEILKGESTRARLLFILSDGKPNDVDVYEGRYGLEDTRMAVREAEREGIAPFCLTVDSGAGDYLPRLFGKGNFAVVSSVARLAARLPELYSRIIHGL
ncbi:MAG: nitric oxide reductase activation protein NorD [Thermodesulfobacteriota bacterium]